MTSFLDVHAIYLGVDQRPKKNNPINVVFLCSLRVSLLTHEKVQYCRSVYQMDMCVTQQSKQMLPLIALFLPAYVYAVCCVLEWNVLETQQERRFGARRNVFTFSIVFSFWLLAKSCFFSLFTIFSLLLNTIQYNSAVWTCEDRNDAKRDSLIVRKKRSAEALDYLRTWRAGGLCFGVSFVYQNPIYSHITKSTVWGHSNK